MPLNDLAPGEPPLGRHALVDIIFIHGLFENSIETLTEAKTGVLWLRDLFLPRTHSSRILAYDYDRRMLLRPGTGDVDPLLNLASNLVVELVADRAATQAYRRPIIFVCHGFGGLLLKRALAWSHSRRSERTEHLRSIYVSTYAILFLGTPHQGITQSALRFAHNEERSGLSQFMISLLADSDMLTEITDQFMPIMKQYHVFNFWEEVETKTSGMTTYIVDMQSAAPTTWADAERCGLMETHMGMMKFRTTNSPGYLVVSEALIRYVKSAPAIISSRWLNEKTFLEAERRRQADELLQPQLEPGSTNTEEAYTTTSIYLVPRNSSPQFTGRTRQAQEVRESFSSQQNPLEQRMEPEHKIFVIHGMGGSGKTQFCLRYAEDNRMNYRGVFWVDASTSENAELGFSKLGEAAGKGSSFAAGKYWLSQCAKPWLLILDNADDPKMEISDFFPITGGGHILITSRNPRTRLYATVGDIRFRGLDPQEGIDLLLNSAYDHRKVLGRDQKEEDLARQLGAELGYLALALSQAGATIRRNIYTLEQYLRAYLGYRDSLLPTTSVKNLNAVTTWEIPFQKIQEQKLIENQDAVDLIHIFAFLHFDAIYEALFRPSVDLPEGTEALITDYPDIIRATFSRSEDSEARLRLALEVLTEHSLIDVESEDDPKSKRYSQHPVVHRWAQDRLTTEKYLSSLGCTIRILARSISPYMEASGQAFRKVLVPHMESCLQKLERTDLSYPRTVVSANSIERFAFVFAECGLWKRAEDLQKRVIRFRSRNLGAKHEDTIRAISGLGQIYWNLFKPDLALKAQRKTITAKRWIWPSLFTFYFNPPWVPDSIGYFSALSDLTRTLWLAGMLDLSKRFGLRATQGLLEVLGPDDPLTLNAMFDLARTLLHLAEWDRAHNLLVPVLKKRKQLFGLNHPDTLMARNELGMLYCAYKQNLAIAERLVTNVLETRKVVLGEEHAYTLWSVNDLSKVLCKRGKGPEAVRLLEPILTVVTRTLGDKHAGMTMTKANLARAYVKCGRWQDAERLLREIIYHMTKDNRDWVRAVSGYVYVQIQLHQWNEAEQSCREVLELVTRKRLLAKDDPRTVAVAEQLAQIFHATDRSSDVKALRAQFPAMDSSVMDRGYRFIPKRTRDMS